MEILEDKRAGIAIVTLTRGELILESLGEVARQADIHSGVVMSGIGKPRPKLMSRMCSSLLGLARCRQFQVSK